MNDRELYFRAKASESRSNARVAPTEESRQAFLASAEEWEREADAAACDKFPASFAWKQSGHRDLGPDNKR